jgi:Protein of unknown function (DUF4246)
MYKVITAIFEHFVCGFEMTLSDIDRRILCAKYFSSWFPVPKDQDIPLGYRRNDDGVQQFRYPIFDPSYSPFPKNIYKLPENIQVIVKIASIQLTPDKPCFNGGSWHLEGTDSECIVATGIFYFHSENITESMLAFRSLAGPPYSYEQNDSFGAWELYGIEDGEALVRNLGSLTCRQDRLVTFKNFNQHRVERFELEDKTRNGYRKILAFFLVDPKEKVLSTKQVPFQNRDLLVEFLLVLFRRVLPVEILEIIAGYAGAIGTKEARVNRGKLMEARKVAFEKMEDDETLQFSLCEH